MRTLLLLAIAALSAFAQPTSVHVCENDAVGAAYPTSIVLCGTVADPDEPFTISVIADGDSDPIRDVDPAYFANSNIDTMRSDTTTVGNERRIIIGHRGYFVLSDNTVTWKAAETNKLHSFNWGGTTGTFTTPTIPINNGSACPFVPGPNGETITPTIRYTGKTQYYIDGCTGVRIQPVDSAGEQYRFAGPAAFSAELGTNWTNATNALSSSDGDAYASYSGLTQDWLYVRGKILAPSPVLGENMAPDYIYAGLRGSCAGADCSDANARKVELQWTWDSVHFSPSYEVTLPNGTLGDVLSYGISGASPVIGSFWETGPIPLQAAGEWGGEGLIYTSGSSTTVSFTSAPACSFVRAGEIFYTKNATRLVSSVDCSGPYTMVVTDDPSIDGFDAAIDLTPPTGMDGWPFRYQLGFFNNAKVGVRFRKKSTTHASAEIRIEEAHFGAEISDISRSSSAGGTKHCSDILTPNDQYLCNWGDRIFAFDPVTGIHNYVGLGYYNGSGCNVLPFGIGGEGGRWSTTNAKRFFTNGQHKEIADGGDALPTVLRVDITEDDTSPDPGQDIGSNVFSTMTFTCTDLFPDGNSLKNILAAYDGHFNPDLYIPQVQNVLYGDHLTIKARHGQDTRAYMAIYDPGNGLGLGGGGDGEFIAGFYLHEGPCSITEVFCMVPMGHHTDFSLNDVFGWMAIQPNINKDQDAGGNIFYVNLVEYCSDPPTCATYLPGMPDATKGDVTKIRVATVWNTMAMGPEPDDFLSGDPITDCAVSTGTCQQAPTSGTLATTGDYWQGHLRVGTNLCGGYFTPECAQIIAIDSPGVLDVKRGNGPADNYWDPQAWTTGTKMKISNPTNPAALYWDYINNPDGTDINGFVVCEVPGGGHTSTSNLYCSGSPDQVIRLFSGGLAAVSTLTVGYGDSEAIQIVRNSEFGAATSYHPGECTEGHISQSIDIDGVLRNVDIHPMIGGPGCFNSPETDATLVDWPIYKFTADQFTHGGLHPKQFPLLARAADKTLLNISGPGSLLTTSTSDYNKVCLTLIPDECYVGSAEGDAYFTSPGLSPNHRKATNSQVVDDVMIGDRPASLSTVNLYNQSTVDNYTDAVNAAKITGTSTLSSFCLTDKPSSNTANGKLLPGGGWVYIQGCSFLGSRQWGLALKVPANAPYTGIDLKTWVPRSVTVSGTLPMGTASIYVEGGYDENFFCKKGSRAEACYFTSDTPSEATPFIWASNWAGESVACTVAPCTVAINSEYGEPLQTRVHYLDAMGMEIAVGPRQVENASAPEPLPGTPPTITTSCPLPAGTQGAAYSQTMMATGDATILWTKTGTLPTGLSLATNGNLTGTPSSIGTATFTLIATNSVDNDMLSCSLTINAAATSQQSVQPRGNVSFRGGVH